MKTIVALMFIALVVNRAAADSAENDNALKCIVQYLKEKGVQEDFFSSVETRTDADCNYLINVKLTRAYGKIHDKLNADTFFSKYSGCIMSSIKTEANKIILLQREAIKLHGLGIKVWNYFSQKEHLDELKKQIETAINKAATEKCITLKL